MDSIYAKNMKKVRSIFVNTPHLLSITDEIHSCRIDSRLGGEPSCILITGNTGSGKSSLIQRYLECYPRQEKISKTLVPVLRTSLPEQATPITAAQQMLSDLGDPLAYHCLNEVSLVHRLVTLIKQCQTELIIIDEFQHMIDRRHSRVLHRVADWLKILIVRTSIPVALFGMPHSRMILESNPQLASRFMRHRKLKPFRIKNKSERIFFKIFLDMLNNSLPFSKSSNLSSKSIAVPLYAASSGNMRMLRNIINEAAKNALLREGEQINKVDFQKATSLFLGDGRSNPFNLSLDTIDFQEPSDDVGWDEFFAPPSPKKTVSMKLRELNDLW